MTAKEYKNELAKISSKFCENLFALRIFNEEIGQLAEEYDQSNREKFITEWTKLTGLSKDDIDFDGSPPLQMRFFHKKHDVQLPKIEPSNAKNSSDNETVDNVLPNDLELDTTEERGNEGSTKISKNFEIEIVDANHFYQLVKFLRSSNKYTARQSKLLRQGALISLVSIFESLEVDLLQNYYLNYPNALPSEGKLLSLADLREIGSIYEAERLLIKKEIDALLRDTTEAQIEYFTKRSKVDLKSLNPYLDTLFEVIQRRNLFVHNNGVVNKIYLSKLNKEGIKQKDLKEGDELQIDSEYLSLAIDTICVCGTILIQQSFRKWDENNEEIANIVLREYTYDLLIEKRWNLVEKLASYASCLKFKSDLDARIIIINHAIALKEQQKIGEMESILSQKDWSSCAIKFHVAIHSLREEYNQFISLLSKAVASEEIDKQAVEEWPLFRWFRESCNYQKEMDILFP